jgi:hypothetical protein
MIDALVKMDIEVIFGEEDVVYLEQILRGDGWTQYNNMSDALLRAEYEARR